MTTIPALREALDWPADGRFTFVDETGEHDPCYVVMPGGPMIPLNHHATPGVDIARAKFIIDACNAALAAVDQAVEALAGPDAGDGEAAFEAWWQDETKPHSHGAQLKPKYKAAFLAGFSAASTPQPEPAAAAFAVRERLVTERQIADMQADHAETFAGKVVMSGKALTELQRTAQIGLDFASEVTRLRAEVESLTRERDMIAAQARAAVDAAQPAWASELSAPLRVGSELFPAGSKLSDVQEAINGVVGNNADWSAYDKGVREAGKAVVERWDTPLWKDVPATAIYIQALRSALRRVPASEAG